MEGEIIILACSVIIKKSAMALNNLSTELLLESQRHGRDIFMKRVASFIEVPILFRIHRS